MGMRDVENIFSVSSNKTHCYCLWRVRTEESYFHLTFRVSTKVNGNKVPLRSELPVPVKTLSDKCHDNGYAYSWNCDASCWKGTSRTPIQCQDFPQVQILLITYVCGTREVRFQELPHLWNIHWLNPGYFCIFLLIKWLRYQYYMSWQIKILHRSKFNLFSFSKRIVMFCFVCYHI